MERLEEEEEKQQSVENEPVQPVESTADPAKSDMPREPARTKSREHKPELEAHDSEFGEMESVQRGPLVADSPEGGHRPRLPSEQQGAKHELEGSEEAPATADSSFLGITLDREDGAVAEDADEKKKDAGATDKVVGNDDVRAEIEPGDPGDAPDGDAGHPTARSSPSTEGGNATACRRPRRLRSRRCAE